ncbi:Rha family phage regulatory protein [Agrobacterium vitis]|nr:Rha family phage regulatory protein [Agrobacterium vitis]
MTTETMNTETVEKTEVQPIVFVKAGGVFANSIDVADFFEKEHRNVLRSIDKLIADAGEEHVLNFEQMVRDVDIGSGAVRQTRTFDMDRDGFMLLAMGFTGEKALKWKLAWIKAFNAMEAELLAHTEISSKAHHPDDIHLPRARDGKVWGVRVQKINAAARMIAVANSIYGPEAARYLWEAEKDLPNVSNKALSVLCDTADDDPVGCFRHMMRAAAGNGRSLGERVYDAFTIPAEMGRVKQCGILVGPVSASNFIAIAMQHPFLARVFSETQWVGSWEVALAQLPGATPSRRKLQFGPVQSKAVMLPKSEVAKLLNRSN